MSTVKSITPYRGIYHKVTLGDIDVANDLLRWHDFAGRNGQKRFDICVDDESAEALRDIGVYVRTREKEDGTSYNSINIRLSWMYDAPYIVERTNTGRIVMLDESTVGSLDSDTIVEIKRISFTTSKTKYNDHKIPYISDMEVVIFEDSDWRKGIEEEIARANAAYNSSMDALKEEEDNLPF